MLEKCIVNETLLTFKVFKVGKSDVGLYKPQNQWSNEDLNKDKLNYLFYLFTIQQFNVWILSPT